MTGCYVSNQIADYCNEPDEEYCPECESQVTEQYFCGNTWLECDNQQCGYTSEED